MKAFIDANLLIYLNTMRDKETLTVLEEFLEDLLARYTLFTNVLVLDEVIYVSRSRYRVPYTTTINFLDKLIPKYINITPLTIREYQEATKIIRQYGLKPSDALHAATCRTNNINYIVSEDKDFDKVEGLKRIWLKQHH